MEFTIAEQQREGMDFNQLEARYPVGSHVEGLCNFVVHDKDKTPFQQVGK